MITFQFNIHMFDFFVTFIVKLIKSSIHALWKCVAILWNGESVH